MKFCDFMKFLFKQMMKASAFYLKKRKSFIPKKTLKAIVNIETEKLCLLTQLSVTVLCTRRRTFKKFWGRNYLDKIDLLSQSRSLINDRYKSCECYVKIHTNICKQINSCAPIRIISTRCEEWSKDLNTIIFCICVRSFFRKVLYYIRFRG